MDTQITEKEWDFAIVGAGLGGGTLGFALAKFGFSVLFIERGKDYLQNPKVLTGNYLETVAKEKGLDLHLPQTWKNAGRWKVEAYDEINNMFYRPILGSGVGGSSALYGMAMERFFPEDFEPLKYHRQETTSTLPDRWPITYEELEPYYEKAEDLYQVKITLPDPLRKYRNFNSSVPTYKQHFVTQLYIQFLKKKGLHPYEIPFAFENKKDCLFCQSFLCHQECKNDSGKVAVKEALRYPSVHLLTECEVQKIHADAHAVQSLLVRSKDAGEFSVKARNFVLAAGAINTPLLLLKSKSDVWPQGVANSSGLVGKNFMRHLIDMYFLPSIFNLRKSKFHLKEFATNDYYVVNGVKYGTSQAFGHLPSADMAFDDMMFEIQQSSPKSLLYLLKSSSPLAKFFLSLLFSHSGCTTPIMEDLPYLQNRVETMDPSPDGTERFRIHYKISDYDQMRLTQFRRLIKKSFFPYLSFMIPMAEKSKLLAHSCGTARFGNDPKKSVLNKFNQSHDLKNLYVVDASFFPSSGGINPSLTIAANAIRVAEEIAKTYRY